VTKVKNPVKCARAVLNEARHPFIFGPAADDFANAANLAMVENSYFTTPRRKSHWESRMTQESASRAALPDMGTVGAVALDIHGRMAAAGSTGGMTCKTPGRLGDTAIMGAGILANRHVAIVW
jgi:L-asparaginase / beta-aspartyl-peptidase